MTCRDELLLLIKEHINSKGKNEFTLSEIVNLSKDKNLNFSESTIRTHISSRMCINSPQNHQTKYEDIERINRGNYKLL